jgi:hypothetical protein
MYLVVAFAVTVLVIVLAWRGIGAARNDEDTPTQRPQAPQRPQRQPRIIAPDDDPEFLSEINRRLRGEDKSS